MKRAKRWIYLFMVGLLLTGLMVATTACSEKETDVPDITLTMEDGSPVNYEAKVRKSVAPGTIRIGDVDVQPLEYDFYYYLTYLTFQNAAMYGMVPLNDEGDIALDEENTFEGLDMYWGMTWGEVISKTAEEEMHLSHALYALALEENLSLTAEEEAIIDEFFVSIENEGAYFGLDKETYLQTHYGELANEKDLRPILERYILAGNYSTMWQDELEADEADILAYYEENKDQYDDADLPIVRHILFLAPQNIGYLEDATKQELRDAHYKAFKALAKIDTEQDMIEVGEAALADFSAAEAEIFEGIYPGQMVEAFDAWCFDESRQVGHKGVIQTEYGYHVIFYVGTEKDWYQDAYYMAMSDAYQRAIDELLAQPQFELTIAY